MLEVVELREARRLLLDATASRRMCAKEAPLAEAFFGVLAEDVTAKTAIPPFDRSVVDGYALAARDSYGASESLPAVLNCVGEIRMGESPRFALGEGECAYIPTGAMLPKGADAVLMLEHSRRTDDGLILAERCIAQGANVLKAGSDRGAGELLLKKGRVLGARELGVLAAGGVASVRIYEKPRVAILSTGDELVPAGAVRDEAKIFEANSTLLAGAVRLAGGEPIYRGVVADDPSALTEALHAAAATSDLVLASGGSSAGERDFMASCLMAEGSLLFHGIAVKPGKPTLAGLLNGTPVLGLAGHPMAAYLLCLWLAVPLLRTLTNRDETIKSTHAYLTMAVPSNEGRETLLPVRLEGETAIPLFGRSGLITPLTEADGFLRIPRGSEGAAAGEQVEVYAFSAFSDGR